MEKPKIKHLKMTEDTVLSFMPECPPKTFNAETGRVEDIPLEELENEALERMKQYNESID